jgi:hypothetical protein
LKYIMGRGNLEDLALNGRIKIKQAIEKVSMKI